MKKMRKKIVILNYGLHISGVTRALINLANTLVNHNYDVTIKIAVNDFTLQDELDSRVKRSMFVSGIGRGKLYGKFMQILEIFPVWFQWLFIVGFGYDVEIAFNRGKGAKVISRSLNRKSKKLCWVHNDYLLCYNALAGFKDEEDAYKGYSRFDHVICVSEQSRVSFCKRFGDTKNLVVCYNVLDTDSIIKKSSKEVIPKHGFTIVSVGRLCEAKNYHLLIDVAAELKSRGLTPEFWIVGDGELHKDLCNYKKQKEVENVLLLGAKKNPYPYFFSADMFLSTSIYEGLSTTTIEALIIGKPVVVTDCTGMRDILGDNEWGKVVAIDKKELADEIERMISDNTYREYYKEKAILRSKDFTTEKLFKGIETYL